MPSLHSFLPPLAQSICENMENSTYLRPLPIIYKIGRAITLTDWLTGRTKLGHVSECLALSLVQDKWRINGTSYYNWDYSGWQSMENDAGLRLLRSPRCPSSRFASLHWAVSGSPWAFAIWFHPETRVTKTFSHPNSQRPRTSSGLTEDFAPHRTHGPQDSVTALCPQRDIFSHFTKLCSWEKIWNLTLKKKNLNNKAWLGLKTQGKENL
jgi:hypothetical protein